jgi:hypothetical protein
VCYSRGFASRSVRRDPVEKVQDVKPANRTEGAEICSEVFNTVPETHFLTVSSCFQVLVWHITFLVLCVGA